MEISLGSVLNTVGDRHTACSWKNEQSLRDTGLFGGGRGQYIQLHLSVPGLLKQKQMNVMYVLSAVSAAVRGGETAEVKQFVK